MSSKRSFNFRLMLDTMIKKKKNQIHASQSTLIAHFTRRRLKNKFWIAYKSARDFYLQLQTCFFFVPINYEKSHLNSVFTIARQIHVILALRPPTVRDRIELSTTICLPVTGVAACMPLVSCLTRLLLRSSFFVCDKDVHNFSKDVPAPRNFSSRLLN